MRTRSSREGVIALGRFLKGQRGLMVLRSD